MTPQELVNKLKDQNALFAPATNINTITLANNSLQNIFAAMLPAFLIDLYKITGGINLGNGYIFGPNEISFKSGFFIPSILQVNEDISTIQGMRGNTVFGRNDLFWFSCDSFGVCTMRNNLNLKPLKTYTNPQQAIIDCLIAGKF